MFMIRMDRLMQLAVDKIEYENDKIIVTGCALLRNYFMEKRKKTEKKTSPKTEMIEAGIIKGV